MRPRLAHAPIVRIANGTFHRSHPNALSSSPRANPPLFANLDFELASSSDPPQNWGVIGPSLSGKTTFLNLLRGRLLCEPPTARSFPYLSTDAVPHGLRSPDRAIRYVGFDGEQAGAGGLSSSVTTTAYLAARYESRREITDFTLRDYLLGKTELNPLGGRDSSAVSPALFERAVANLRLDALLDLPVSFLSNGQGRRARIAKALLATPEVLLLDEPFMGLDPPTVRALDPLLGSLANEANPRIVFSARPQDEIPEWITHILYLKGDCQVEAMGTRDEVLSGRHGHAEGMWTGGGLQKDQAQVPSEPSAPAGEVAAAEKIVEMDGCLVKYGDKVALGNWSQSTPAGDRAGLFWTVRRGGRWAVFGPNGSGKTTLVSLLSSDHPQAYSLPIKLFGRSRLPQPGSAERPLTFWDIQSRVGHSSPEVHQHMPRNLSVRAVVENAWADTFKSRPRLDAAASAKVDAALRWFAPELHHSHASASSSSSSGPGEADLSWADDHLLRELSFSAQRVALFIRAVVKGADIVVLDEAFSGMDESIRDKCALFLSHGEEKTIRGGEVVESEVSKAGGVKVRGLSDLQALVCISHVKEEVPDCVREWMCLPEANSGLPARFGRLERPLRGDDRGWLDIWGL